MWPCWLRRQQRRHCCLVLVRDLNRAPAHLLLQITCTGCCGYRAFASCFWFQLWCLEVTPYMTRFPCGCAGSRRRHHTLVCCGRDHLGVAALNSAAASRIDFRTASSRLHAHDGEPCPYQFVRNGPRSLRIWRRCRDCRADVVLGNSICQVRRSIILSNGSSLRHRTAVCLVRLR